MPGEERRRVEREPDHDPVVTEAVEVGFDDKEDPAHEPEQGRWDEDPVRDPLDVCAERGEPRRIAGHRGPDPEELHHQTSADPDHGHRHVEEQQERVPGHLSRGPCP